MDTAITLSLQNRDDPVGSGLMAVNLHQCVDRLGQLAWNKKAQLDFAWFRHLRRDPQNGPSHIRPKLLAAHSAVRGLLNSGAVLSRDVPAYPPHARRTGADTNGRGKRRGTANGLHGLLKWCHGSFFVNTNVIVKQTPT